MKKIRNITISLVTMVAMAHAGGDIAPMEPELEALDTTETPAEFTGFYAGLGFALVSAKEDSASLNFTAGERGQDRIGNITLLGGYNINEYVAIEARYTSAIASDDIATLSSAAIYAKPQYAVTEDIAVYGLLGYGQVSVDAVNGSNVDVSASGFQWGLGASWDITREISLYVDYSELARDMDGTFLTSNSFDAAAINVGMTYKF